MDGLKITTRCIQRLVFFSRFSVVKAASLPVLLLLCKLNQSVSIRRVVRVQNWKTGKNSVRHSVMYSKPSKPLDSPQYFYALSYPPNNVPYDR